MIGWPTTADDSKKPNGSPVRTWRGSIRKWPRRVSGTRAIHDVLPAQIVRELLDTIPVGAPSATLRGPREIPAGSRDDPAERVDR